jgi:protein involved in polysaccharide export with SLBB domain
MRWIAVVFALLLLQTGCQSNQSTPVLSPEKFTTVTGEKVADDSEAKPVVMAQAHVIVPGAVISITVDRDHTFNRAFTVPNDGAINYPSLGRTIVAGLTSDEVADRVRKALEKNYFLKSPVAVTILSTPGSGSGVIYVIGNVNRPGPVTLSKQRRLTITGAISAAGDLSTSADGTEVQLIRYDAAGKKHVSYINVDRIMRGGESAADVLVQNGDWIVVP